jgi:hypothetical protein
MRLLAIMAALSVMMFPSVAVAQEHSTAVLHERTRFVDVYTALINGVSAEQFEPCARWGVCPTQLALDASSRPRYLRDFRRPSLANLPSPADVAETLLGAGVLKATCLMDLTAGSDARYERRELALSREAMRANPRDPRRWFSHRCVPSSRALTVRAGRGISYEAIHRPTETTVRAVIADGAGSSDDARTHLQALAGTDRQVMLRDVSSPVISALLGVLVQRALGAFTFVPQKQVVYIRVPLIEARNQLHWLTWISVPLCFIFGALLLFQYWLNKRGAKDHKQQIDEATTSGSDAGYKTGHDEGKDEGIKTGRAAVIIELGPAFARVRGLATKFLRLAGTTISPAAENDYAIMLDELTGAIDTVLKKAAEQASKAATTAARREAVKEATDFFARVSGFQATEVDDLGRILRAGTDATALAASKTVSDTFARAGILTPSDAPVGTVVAKGIALLASMKDEALHALNFGIAHEIHAAFSHTLGGEALPFHENPTMMLTEGLKALQAKHEGTLALLGTRSTTEYGDTVTTMWRAGAGEPAGTEFGGRHRLKPKSVGVLLSVADNFLKWAKMDPIVNVSHDDYGEKVQHAVEKVLRSLQLRVKKAEAARLELERDLRTRLVALSDACRIEHPAEDIPLKQVISSLDALVLKITHHMNEIIDARNAALNHPIAHKAMIRSDHTIVEMIEALLKRLTELDPEVSVERLMPTSP